MYTGTFGSASNRARWDLTFNLIDADNGNAPVDLTDATIEVAISNDPDGETPLLSATVGNGVTVPTPTDGSFTFSFTRAQMQELRSGPYKVGILITLSGGSEFQLAAADLAVVHGVVRKQ